MKAIEQVLEFHRTFGHPIGEVANIPAPARVKFRINFLREELGELLLGVMTKNIVEVADGVTDCLYVTDGFLIEAGWFDYEKWIYEPGYDEYFQNVLAMSIDIPKLPTEAEFPYFLRIIAKLFDSILDLEGHIVIEDKKAFLETLTSFRSQLVLLSIGLGLWGIQEQLTDEVHRSNMTKACISMDEARATVTALVPTMGELTISQVGEKFVVSKGAKAMKSINYSPADLVKVLKENGVEV